MVFGRIRKAFKRSSQQRKERKASFKALVSKEREKFRGEKIRKRAKLVARAPSFSQFVGGAAERGARKATKSFLRSQGLVSRKAPVRKRRRRKVRQKQPRIRTGFFAAARRIGSEQAPRRLRRKPRRPIQFF